MYKRVLIPVDGSDVAEAILPLILDIAGPLDLEIVLLTVNQPIRATAIEAGQQLAVDGLQSEVARTYLAGLATEMRAKGLRVETLVRRGEPVSEILAAAQNTGADLIAMTTHGRTGPTRLLFGSIAEGVLRQSEIPVFLMRQTERDVARRRREEVPR
jgi:nucleotide-binding universal stress UspA family protein